MKHRFRPLGPKARISIAIAATTVAAASAQVATASPVAAPESADGPSLAESCATDEAVLMGRYYLSNTWAKDSGAGRQCVQDAHDGDGSETDEDTIAWNADWRWSDRAGEVTPAAAYAVRGWHWGWKSADTGLPVRLSSADAVTATWDFAVEGRSEGLRVGYRLWLHDQPDPGPKDRPSDEVTVWLHRADGARPTGRKQTTVEVDGVRWDLYHGGGSRRVHSFVPSDTGNAPGDGAGATEVDLTALLAELTRRGAVSEDAYLSGVEAGAEVRSGHGGLRTESLTVRVG